MSADTKSAKKRAFQARTIGPATINNPTESDYEACRSAVDNKTLKYITFNLEVGEEGSSAKGYSRGSPAAGAEPSAGGLMNGESLRRSSYFRAARSGGGTSVGSG